MFHFPLVANILGKVCFKRTTTPLDCVFFFRFLNGPFRCLDQRCRFKEIDLVDLKHMRKWQILVCERLPLILKILR